MTRTSAQLCLLALFALCLSAANVQLSDSWRTNFTILGPLFANSTTNPNNVTLPFGPTSFTWIRQRPLGNYSLFTETYVLQGVPTCTINCAPHSKPVVSDSRLYCLRDSGPYNANSAVNHDGTPFKQHCVPDASGGLTGNCQFATYFQSMSNPECSFNYLKNFSPIYSSQFANLDCCSNNNNDSPNNVISIWTDSSAKLI